MQRKIEVLPYRNKNIFEKGEPKKNPVFENFPNTGHRW